MCKIKYGGGVSHHFGGVLTSLKNLEDISEKKKYLGPPQSSRRHPPAPLEPLKDSPPPFWEFQFKNRPPPALLPGLPLPFRRAEKIRNVHQEKYCAICWPPSSQSCSSERTLFGALWKMSRSFREVSCGHFPWKLNDENLQKKTSTHFLPVSCKNLARTSLWGIGGIRYGYRSDSIAVSRDMGPA